MKNTTSTLLKLNAISRAFVHKACFNTSRLIVDHIAEGTDFRRILKVFHISILYFPVGNEPIHHGQTDIRGIESKERLTVHIRNPETNAVIDATNILPEYFFISVPLFNDRLEKEIDDWLYVMKHDNVPKNFHSPYMQKVADKLNILKMTPAERNAYYAYMKQVYTDMDSIETALARGRGEKAREIARRLIKRGRPLHEVCEDAKLDIEVVQELAAEIAKKTSEDD